MQSTFVEPVVEVNGLQLTYGAHLLAQLAEVCGWFSVKHFGDLRYHVLDAEELCTHSDLQHFSLEALIVDKLSL